LLLDLEHRGRGKPSRNWIRLLPDVQRLAISMVGTGVDHAAMRNSTALCPGQPLRLALRLPHHTFTIDFPQTPSIAARRMRPVLRAERRSGRRASDYFDCSVERRSGRWAEGRGERPLGKRPLAERQRRAPPGLEGGPAVVCHTGSETLLQGLPPPCCMHTIMLHTHHRHSHTVGV